MYNGNCKSNCNSHCTYGRGGGRNCSFYWNCNLNCDYNYSYNCNYGVPRPLENQKTQKLNWKVILMVITNIIEIPILIMGGGGSEIATIMEIVM